MEITQNLTLQASPEVVFNAVATNQGIKSWWCKDSIVGEKEGHRSLLKFDKNKDGNIIEMLFRTETITPNKKVVWECIDNANPAWIGTKLVTEISEGVNGTEVLFSHTNFDAKWEGQDPFEMTKGGWLGVFIPSLASFCEAGTGQPW